MSTETGEGSVPDHVASPTNYVRGRSVTHAAAERWPMQPVGDSDRDPDWYDLVTVGPETGGRPVEAKGCRLDVGARPRPGRFWIKLECHERLLEADGLYVLGVYDDEDRVQAIEIRDAQEVDEALEGRWTDCGRSHYGGKSAQIQFDYLMGPGGRSR